MGPVPGRRDATALLPRLGRFDLIFADAEGGKLDHATGILLAVRQC